MTITMYGADWCGDCRRAKDWFAENGVPYTYIDLIEAPEANGVVLERNGGEQRIPVIVFDDDTHLTEPSNDDLAAKVAVPGSSDTRIIENADDGRFEMWRSGELISYAEFSTRAGGVLVVPHVETVPAHRGSGNAALLLDAILGLLRSTNRTIVPLCSFAAGHIRANERHLDLIAR